MTPAPDSYDTPQAAPVTPPAPPKLDAPVRVFFTAAERQRLEGMARRDDRTLSSYLRRIVVGHLTTEADAVDVAGNA